MTGFHLRWRQMDAKPTAGQTHGVRGSLLAIVAFVALITLVTIVARPSGAADNPAGPAVVAQVPHAITPLKDAPFAQDEDVKCLQSALENGNPDTGPSTFILKTPAGCRVPAHYHSAEEQLIVIRGSVLTGMKGMRSVTLTAGGVAVMPAKAIHWFSCSGKDPCLMVVTFDRKYDIVWVDAHSST